MSFYPRRHAAGRLLRRIYAWRSRLFRVHAGRVFELRRDGGVRFEVVAALPAGAVPFTEAEAQQLGDDIHDAASRIVHE